MLRTNFVRVACRAAALLTVATYAVAAGNARRPSRHLCGEAGRHPLGHRRDVPEEALAVAGNLAGQPADQESAPDLSGRRHQPGLPGPRRDPARPAPGGADRRHPAGRHRAVPEGPARGRQFDSCRTWSAWKKTACAPGRARWSTPRAWPARQPGQRYAVVRPDLRYTQTRSLRRPCCDDLQGRPGFPRQARGLADHRLGACWNNAALDNGAQRDAGLRTDPGQAPAR